MVGVNLKTYRGIVLNPGGMNVEHFETGVVRGIGRLLCSGTEDVRDRLTKSW